MIGACGTAGGAGVAGVDAGAGAGSPPARAPPVDALAGAAAVPMIVKLNKNVLRARARKPPILFRRPAGLADGLALKEPALHTGLPCDSPQQFGSPVPGFVPRIRRVARQPSSPLRRMQRYITREPAIAAPNFALDAQLRELRVPARVLPCSARQGLLVEAL